MPYIIITTQREITEDVDAWRGSVLEHEISRTAVATLEEARETVVDAMTGTPGYGLDAATRLIVDAGNLPADGGTVGPLPDGTVIEVRPVRWDDLGDGDHDGPRGEGWARRTLAAFNGAHA